jgi:dipeptidyl aminopeptidase/acylaminoacyl peptidase
MPGPSAVRRPILFAAALLLAAAAAPTAAQRPITPEDLWSLGRVGAPAVSPDGQSVVYPVTRYDLDADRGTTQLWMVPTAGGEPRQLTTGESSSSSPAWSPDGRWIAFVSSRNEDGRQVWLMPAAGGEARQLTRLEGGAGGPVWSQDGSLLAVAGEVWPDGDPLADRMRELSSSSSSAMIFDELMYRHWDTWEDGMRSHVFAVDPESGEARDLTPGAHDTPPIGLGGFRDYDLSPDGSELAFVRNTDVPTAVGTGNDIWLVSAGGGEPRLLTESDGNDVSPQYSPDGRWIAYLAQERAGFEADRTELMLYDREAGTHARLTPAFDRSVSSFAWAPDSRAIWLNAQDELHVRIYRLPLGDGRPGELEAVTDGAYDGAFALAGDGLVVARQEAQSPTELFLLDRSGEVERQLTDTNAGLLSELALQPVEPFWFEGAEGDRVQGFLVKPPDFDPEREWPVLFLVHGGPQGAWTDNFHYRWNYNMFAAPGYVVVAVNPRGSTGYGQEFTDEITMDWGGRVFEDLMNGLDHALAEYDYLDGDRMAAAGASYGGYMMNWFQGHTDRFRTIVNHDGLFDLRSMYFATEELWFPEWEFGGPPWEGSDAYDRWNPAASVEEWDTPMLIVHGAQDFRVPLEQGLAAFTALRRRDVPARLLVFPDEGHWVLRPSNALVWWETIYDWVDRYLEPPT